MAKETTENTLLDYWVSPVNLEKTEKAVLVNPISFISTTYTFDSEFFEDECLTRFLSMETERENDGVAFLVEKEEKLAGLQGGIIIVDQNNCKGERSLRWDLVPCRVKNGVMHAKITVLHWSNCIRVIISSANLTKNGYCINQEIFGVIDYLPNGDADLKIINDVLDYLNQLISKHCGDVIIKRFKKQQSEIRKILAKWNIQEKLYKKYEVALKTLFVSPTEKDALVSLRSIWDSSTSSPPSEAYITSPFFDSEESENTPSKKIFSIMKQKGNVGILYNVTTEAISETASRLLVNAPEFLTKVPNSGSHYVSFEEVSEEGLNENGKMVPRPLHLKSIWLNNDDQHLCMIGSSNFTSAGLGLNKRINYEANLVYTVSETRNKKEYKLLHESYLESTNKLDLKNLKFKYRKNDDEDAEEKEYLNLPDCFGEAVLKKKDDSYFLELNVEPQNIKKGFKLHSINDQTKVSFDNCIYNYEVWEKDGSKEKILLKLNDKSIPEYILVNWNDSNGNAFWPLIVEDQITLPPVEELRNLPLEALIQILSSSQPLHRLLKTIENIKKKKPREDSIEKVVNALDLVDSSSFLLQRTRRISYAMRAIRERLEKPVYTIESLNWRLYGPIGVKSLKDAISNEAKNEEEKMFLLAELALELSRIQPTTTEYSIKASDIKSSLKIILKELFEEFASSKLSTNSAVTDYSNQAFKQALNEL